MRTPGGQLVAMAPRATPAWAALVALVALLVTLGLGALPTANAAVAAIDLGTEWFKVSLVKPGVPMEIVLNRETKRKTASIVGLRNEERLFGEDAIALVRGPRGCSLAGVAHSLLTNMEAERVRNGEWGLRRRHVQLTRSPRDTYTRVLNVIGHNANDSAVARHRERYPNIVEADERGAAAFRGDGDHLWFAEVGRAPPSPHAQADGATR